MVDSDDLTPKVPEYLTSQDDFSAEDRLYYGISTYRTTASNMGYDLGRLEATWESFREGPIKPVALAMFYMMVPSK